MSKNNWRLKKRAPECDLLAKKIYRSWYRVRTASRPWPLKLDSLAPV